MNVISVAPAEPGMYRLQDAGDNDGDYVIAELVVMWVTSKDDIGTVHVYGLSVIEVGRPIAVKPNPVAYTYTTKLPANTRLQIIR